MQHKKIIFLASDCQSSRWVYSAVLKKFNIEAAIIENPISKISLIKRRIKKIGLIKVFGQVLFTLIMVPILKFKGKERSANIIQQYKLLDAGFIPDKTQYISSVNEEACRLLLEQIQPDIIIVNGTRIINKEILQCCNAVFINMHAGITPMYRGSHGGYWSIRNNDEENFGTTIHIVDAGVDTGNVLKQAFIKPIKEDNFTTYPVLQTAAGIEALMNVLAEVISNNYQLKSHTGKGKLYYQPTIWEYISGRAK